MRGGRRLFAVEPSEPFQPMLHRHRPLVGAAAAIALIALLLGGCEQKPQAAAAAPPALPVTVAQAVKRTVTDWDEFTGRFDAVEEVQVKARVGGFVTNVEFRDGTFVKE